MAIPVIVQTTGGSSSSAAPATYAPTWTASTAGTCLVMVLASATSATPVYTPPANWITGPTQNNLGGVNIAVFYYPNNPGALTTGTWGLTNVNGIANVLYEVSGIPIVTPFDSNSPRGNTSSSTSAGSPAYSVNPYNNVFMLGIVACLSGSTLTDASTNGTVSWVQATQQVSTIGATNVRLYTASLIQGAYPNLRALINATVSPATQWATLQITFLSTSSGALSYSGAQEAASAGAGFAQGI